MEPAKPRKTERLQQSNDEQNEQQNDQPQQ